MARDFKKGDRVLTEKFGEGEIRSMNEESALVRILSVAADVRLPLWTLRLAAKLTSTAESRALETEELLEVAAAPSDHDAFQCRVIVECLRQGLPPRDAIEAFTVGERVQEAIRDGISAAIEGRGSCLVLQAPYGQGKSHWGQYAREVGLQKGMMTMHVELDGQQLSLARTTSAVSVVAELLESARLPAEEDSVHDDVADGFRWVLRRATREYLVAMERIERARRGLLVGPVLLPAATRTVSVAKQLVFLPLITHAVSLTRNDELVILLEKYLIGLRSATEASREVFSSSGEGVRLRSTGMSSGRAEARRAAQAAVLEEAVLLGIVAGARGAVLVIDELDHDLPYWNGGVGETLKTWAALVRDYPIVLILLSPERIDLGSSDVMYLELKAVSRLEAAELVEKAIEAYGKAFPCDALHKGKDELLDALWDRFENEYEDAGWGPRFFVRAAIEACDVARTLGLESLSAVDVGA